jgi:hypothetical protein
MQVYIYSLYIAGSGKVFAMYGTGCYTWFKKMKLTKNEEEVLQFLKNANGLWKSPTEIGNVVGGGKRHSAWASPICKKLVEKELAKRHGCGWYASV